MSKLVNTITQVVEDTVNNLVDKLSKKLNIDKKELFDIINDVTENRHQNIEDRVEKPKAKKQQTIDHSVPEKKSDIPSELELQKCSKDDLKALCKSKGMKVSGKKDDLIQRLVKGEKKASPTRKKSPIKKQSQSTIEKSIKKEIPTIQIRRNKFGNYEHAESQLVFDKDEQVVYGKQSETSSGDSQILELTKEDIETCNKFKFKFRQPDNLTDNNFIKVSELEDESDKSENFDDITEQDDLLVDDDEDLGEFYESD